MGQDQGLLSDVPGATLPTSSWVVWEATICSTIGDPNIDIVSVQFQEEVGHLFHPRRAIVVDPPFESGHPGFKVSISRHSLS